MTLDGLQDWSMGIAFLVTAPFFPLVGERSAEFLNIAEVGDAFTLIIQFLSAVLLAKRLLKNKDNEKET